MVGSLLRRSVLYCSGDSGGASNAFFVGGGGMGETPLFTPVSFGSNDGATKVLLGVLRRSCSCCTWQAKLFSKSSWRALASFGSVCYSISMC